MTQIEICTDNLIQAILSGPEYRHFCELHSKVAENPELREQINRFRLSVFEIQNSQEPLDMYGEQVRLCREYDEAIKNPLVEDYLRAELRVCRIIQQITLKLAEQVDLDTREIVKNIPL